MINNSVPVSQFLSIQEPGVYFSGQTVFIKKKERNKKTLHNGANFFITKVLQWQPGCLIPRAPHRRWFLAFSQRRRADQATVFWSADSVAWFTHREFDEGVFWRTVHVKAGQEETRAGGRLLGHRRPASWSLKAVGGRQTFLSHPHRLSSHFKA